MDSKECHIKCESKEDTYSNNAMQLVVNEKPVKPLLNENPNISKDNESKIVSETIEDQLKQLKIEPEKDNLVAYSDQNHLTSTKIYKLRVTKLPKKYGICVSKI